MIRFIKHTPNFVLQLVQNPLQYIIYTYVCELGAGGVWCSGTNNLDPCIQQFKWPSDIRQALVTRENPNGRIFIITLEPTGAVIAFLILEHRMGNLQYAHLVTFCDNMSAVAWVYKLRTSKYLTAGQLVEYQGSECMLPKHQKWSQNMQRGRIISWLVEFRGPLKTANFSMLPLA